MSRTKLIHFTCPHCQTPQEYNWDISVKQDGNILTYCDGCKEPIVLYAYWEPVIEVYTLTPAVSDVTVD